MRNPIRAFAVLLLGLAASPALSQDALPSNDKWKTVEARAIVAVGGNEYEAESAGRPWSVQVARATPADIVRFELRPGDQWDEDRGAESLQERSQLDGYKTRWPSGADIWGAYSFFIEPGAAYRAEWNAIIQMQGTRIRPFHVHFNGEIFRVVTEHFNAESKPTIVARSARAISRNTWHNVVFHLREDANGKGRLEFWLNGLKIVDYAGSIGASDGEVFWKFGPYRGFGPIAAPFAIQFANMQVGTADLTARIKSPLSIP
jgi:hypothetical protein